MADVVVDGLRVAYREAGSGPPLVLLHGGTDDSRSWRWQLEGLADEFRVLAWDCPGAGRSGEPPVTWRLPDFADAAAGWLGALGVGPAHVLGLSWGSTVALALAARHPGRVRSLILASAYAGWAGSLPPQEVAARFAGAMAEADSPPEEVAKAFPGVLGPAATPAVAAELAAVWADNCGLRHPAGYRAMISSMAEADVRPVLADLAVPVLLLYGELDQRSPLSVAHDLHARIPGSELVVLPGAGHSSSAETPEPFNAAVRAFVRRTVDAAVADESGAAASSD